MDRYKTFSLWGFALPCPYFFDSFWGKWGETGKWRWYDGEKGGGSKNYRVCAPEWPLFMALISCAADAGYGRADPKLLRPLLLLNDGL